MGNTVPIMLDPAADGWCLMRCRTGELVLVPLQFSAGTEAILSGAQVYAELYDDGEEEP